MTAQRTDLRQAAEWFAVLHSDGAGEAERRRWRDWLAASPGHRAAWAQVEQVERQFQDLPAAPARSALDAADAGRRRALKALGVFAVAAPGLWLAGRHRPWAVWGADYRTAVGEVRELRLAEGSRLWLNTDSALDVRYSPEARLLVLHQGEALLETAADRRPLTLATPHGRLQSVGTRFGARIDAGRTLAYVQRGAVQARPQAGGSTRLAAGQMASLGIDGIGPVRPLPEGQGAWTQGLMVANGRRLGELLTELARYRSGYLGWSEAVAHIRVLGTYPLADTERVLDALERSLPVRVERRSRWWVRVVPR